MIEGDVLTAAQCAEAERQLRDYLAEYYRRGHPFRQPTFRMVRRTLSPGMGGFRGEPIPRRSLGTHSDPTPLEAIGNLEGIDRLVPETVEWPPEAVARLLAALPNHLFGPLDLAVLRRNGTIVGAAYELRKRRETVSAACEQAVRMLCALMYEGRWPAEAGPDAEASA